MKNAFLIFAIVLTTAVVSGGLVYLFSPNFPKFPNSPNPSGPQNQSSAARTVSISSTRFQPGIEKLNNLYVNQPEMVSGSSFLINLQGIVKLVSSENLVIKSNTSEFSISLNDKDSKVSFYQSENESAPPKPADKNVLKHGDLVKIKLYLNPETGKIIFSFVTRINQQ